jgi:hypothetical protein
LIGHNFFLPLTPFLGLNQNRSSQHALVAPSRLNGEKEKPSFTMAAGPGEAMAHSAFDTILVLDFG